MRIEKSAVYNTGVELGDRDREGSVIKGGIERAVLGGCT